MVPLRREVYLSDGREGGEIRLLQEPFNTIYYHPKHPSDGGPLPSITINFIEGLMEMEITALGVSFDVVLTLDFFGMERIPPWCLFVVEFVDNGPLQTHNVSISRWRPE